MFVRTEITKYLLFASRQAIRGISLDANAAGSTPPEAIPPIVHSEASFVALDYDFADEYIYYSDVRKSSILRIHTNGTGRLSRFALINRICSRESSFVWNANCCVALTKSCINLH